MRVDIYMPRLDVTFKEGPVPETRSPIPPIREHWLKFLQELQNRHLALNHEIRVLEVPLWQITPSLVADSSQMADIIYIPHKMRENWWLDERVRYYMQMVIPNIFSIDTHGWCATNSNYPIMPRGDGNSGVYEMLRARIKGNISKFDQPPHQETDIKPGYIFFPCQIPHDETIKYHSDISVENALRNTIRYVNSHNSYTPKDKHLQVVIKGHPVNPGSMVKLREIFAEEMHPDRAVGSPCIWVDNMSIHQLIENAKVVVTVNSGVGLEAILHGKSVFTFGRADYDSVTHKVSEGLELHMAAALHKAYKELNEEDIFIYKKFIDSWYNANYDHENPRTFEKIK